MGVDQRVVDWLREQGHEVAHLRDDGLHRMADEDVFAKAIAEDRIVLTFDLDFGEIAALSRGRKASVVQHRVIDRLAAAIAGAPGALADGAVVTVEESRIRIRPLPIGRTTTPP